MEKRLYRSRTDRMIWGVCGGIAQYFGIDSTVIRVIAVLLAVVSGGGAILAYIILAIVVPLESSAPREPRDVIRENVEEIKQTATQFGEDMRSTFGRHETGKAEVVQSDRRGVQFGGLVIAVILIVIGVIILLTNFNFFWWLRWTYLWPLILIVLGIWILMYARRR